MTKARSPESGHLLPAVKNWFSGMLLDDLASPETPYPEQYELMEIISALGMAPEMATFETLAKDLSSLAGKTPPWSAKYIHSVYHGYAGCRPSPRLARAISALAQRIDGSPPGVAGSVFVKVLASPEIPEGVLLPAGSQVIKCKRPGCPVRFIKTHPSQAYHHPACRKRGKSR
jgi:hypothetical protein